MWQGLSLPRFQSAQACSVRRKPSGIPSRTRSVPAFLPHKVSVGPRSSGDVARAAAIRPFNGVKLGAQSDVTHLRESHLSVVVGRRKT